MPNARDSKRPSDIVSVGVIADTHGLIRPEVARIFEGVDLIVHAGDVGGQAVLDLLSTVAPVEAVYGNTDDPNDPALVRERTVPIGGLMLHVSHGHELGQPTPQLVAARYAGDILVFGHTHRAIVVETLGVHGERRLIVNPGAAGPRRFDIVPTVARLTVSGAKAVVDIVEIISLA